jgi:hypothetical protein
LLYAGVLIFVGGLGWTVSTWSQQLGDVLVVGLLSALLAACFWYCFSRAPEWSPKETRPPSLAFDYVLYLGSLVWSIELAYVENRFQLLGGEADLYLMVTAGLFFFLAYRFDNRFVLLLALTTLAGYFGLTISHWKFNQNAVYRQSAILYSFLIGGAGAMLARRDLKAHFFGTYLNLAANVLFWALLAGIFDWQERMMWLLFLLVACGVSLAWGLQRRQFAFVAYASLYGYVGLSAVLVGAVNDALPIMLYFLITGVAMLVFLFLLSRRFGREQ